MLKEIKQVIKEAEKQVKKCPKSDLVHSAFSNPIENLFYANLINNFKNNLTADNIKEFKISEKEDEEINKNFEKLFEKTQIALEETEGINEKDYIPFKEKLRKISKGAYKLLLEIEKSMEFSLCEKEIDKFKKNIKRLGKNLGISPLEDENKVGLSMGFK